MLFKSQTDFGINRWIFYFDYRVHLSQVSKISNNLVFHFFSDTPSKQVSFKDPMEEEGEGEGDEEGEDEVTISVEGEDSEVMDIMFLVSQLQI